MAKPNISRCNGGHLELRLSVEKLSPSWHSKFVELTYRITPVCVCVCDIVFEGGGGGGGGEGLRVMKGGVLRPW